MPTGIRAIDGFCTLAYGQRIGLFAPAGVGKSTLLGAMARGAAVDVVVAALVGERGREVNEFITDVLGPEGQKRAIVVVSTGDEPPLRRAYAPRTATAIAEYHRSHGRRVLLLVDSLTRAARALREIGLAAGEIPVRHGFTPSVYAELPRLLERAGTDEHGSITAIYTVLTHEEAESDPLGDEIKSLLDGHIVLSSRAFRRGRRPAIDIPRSISRLAHRVRTESLNAAVMTCAAALERLERDRDVVLFGGQPDAALSAALRLEGELEKFLSQSTHEHTPLEESFRRLTLLAESLATRA
jgi:type III secretion protein N (ATPase)